MGRFRVRSFAVVCTALVVSGITVAGGPAAASPGATRPDPVSAVAAFQKGHAVSLDWTNPRGSFASVVVRYARGSNAPSTVTAGRGVRLASAKARTARLAGLRLNTRYAVSIWTRDAAGHYSRAARSRFYTEPRRLPSPAKGLGTVNGTVTDAAGTPLGGAVIDVIGSDASVARSATTRADGTFSLHIAAGRYEAVVDGAEATGGNSDATGYVPRLENVRVTASRASTVSVRLAAGAAITGTVLGPDGQPVGGAVPFVESPFVPYVQAQNAFFSMSFDLDGAPTTSANGTYAIRGVGGGSQHICVGPSRGLSSTMSPACSPQTFWAHAGQSITVPPIQLSPAASGASMGALTGTVRTRHGRPVDRAVIDYQSPSGLVAGFALADSHGTYRVQDLAAGRYRVCAGPGFAVAASPGVDPDLGELRACASKRVIIAAGRTSRKNFALGRAGAVAGRIRGPHGAPVADADVLVQATTGASSGSASTDRRGDWVVTGLAAGTYTVCVDTTSSARTAHTPTGPTTGCFGHRAKTAVTVGRVRVGIDFRLGVGGEAVGTVLDHNGAPVAAAQIEADQRNNAEGYQPGEATTDVHGHYRLTGLPAGRYEICASSDLDEFTQRCSSGVVVRAGSTTKVATITMPAPTVLSVLVTDAAGHPLDGVDVAALASCGDRLDGCPPQPLFSATTPVDVADSGYTDTHGTYATHDLQRGTYAICAFAYYAASPTDNSPTGYADGCYSTAFNVHVAKGATTAVTIKLADAGEITGRVTDTTGHALRGVTIHARGSAADDYADSADSPPILDGLTGSPKLDAVTRPDGTFDIRSVRAGATTVCTSAKDAVGGTSTTGYQDECTDVTVTERTVTSNVILTLPAA